MTGSSGAVAPYRSIPVSDAIVVFAVLVTGSAAAQLAVPALWLVTPVVAASLAVAAVVGMRHRVGVTDVTRHPLPPRVERSVAEAVASLPAGPIREDLVVLVQRARSLVAATAHEAGSGRLGRDVADLVDACCEMALEHGRLDAMLPALWEPAFAPVGARGTADDANADELGRRGAAGRELLAKRIRDATAALDALLVQHGMQRSDDAAQQVADLIAELAREAEARRHASEEIGQLLRKRGER